MTRSRYVIDEGPFLDAARAYAVEKLLTGIRPVIVEDICDWCEKTIDLSFDKTSSASGLVKLYPYQREILRACDDPSVQEVTIMASQRSGKSQLWKFSLLKRLHDGGLSGLVVYPSAELGERTNRDTVVPLMQTLPEANRDLSIRGNKTKSSFHLPSLSSVIYFLGGGSQVISATANWVVLDECDFIDLREAEAEDRNMSQIKALRLRMQSFKRRMMIVCSSPSQATGTVNVNYKRGSMGEWNMRCLKCGGLSPTNKLAYFVDGKEWRGLQWEKDGSGEIIVDSIRWICPHCGHAHTYDQAFEMNERGCFVHQRPNNTAHRSYQIGALANPQLWTWLEIAKAQEDATDGDGKKYLANTILGVPYSHRREGDLSISIEDINHSRQGEYPEDLGDRLSIVVAGIDRQASDVAGGMYYVSVVRGWCEDGSSYLLSCGIDRTPAEVKARISADYLGHRVSLALMDNGGFETSELQPFIESVKPLYWFKGTSGKFLDWKDFKVSDNVKKLILCDAVGYQVRLLEELYSSKDASRWHLPVELDPQYFQELCNVQPAKMTKDGSGYDYANWCVYGASRRDFFDCEKMSFAALDVACTYLPAQSFRHGHKPKFWIQRELKRISRLKSQGERPDDAR